MSSHRTASLAALLTALLLTPTAWAGKQHVIPPGGERALLKRVAPEGAGPLAGWALDKATIDKDRVALTFGKDGASATVTLRHPSVADGGATLAGGTALSGAPADLVAAVATRLGDEPAVRWQEVDDGADLGNEAPAEEPPPTDPDGAEPAPAEHDVVEPVLELVGRVDHLIARGDGDMAARAVKDTPTRVATTPMSQAVLAVLAAATGDSARASDLARGVPEGAATPLARIVLDPELTPADLLVGRTGEDACAVAGLAPYVTRLGQADKVPVLLEAILAAHGDCIPARVALAFHHIDAQEGEAALVHVEALADRYDDPGGVARLRAGALRLAGRLDDAIDEVERLVRGPHREAGDMGLLLGMYLREKELPKRIDLWRAHEKAHPDDVVAPFMIGVLLHYGNEFEESDRWLGPLNGRLVGEPRLFVYQAMNAFNLGDTATARRMLDEGAELEVVDPDIYYCRAEITRDTERELARSDLNRYLALTEGTPHANEKKQARVREMLAHLEQCIADGTPKCGGPWEHPRRPYLDLAKTLAWPALGTLLVALAIGLWWRRRSR